MNIEFAKRWINKRLASKRYYNFLLADLFYKGLVPEEDCYSLYTGTLSIDEDSCKELVYNSLSRPIKKKINYLLSKSYTVEGAEEVKEYFKDCNKLYKATIEELCKKGEVWWEYEADPKSPIKYKITLRKAEKIVPHYTNEEMTEYDAVGYLWNKIDEEEKVHRFADFVDLQGRHRFSIDNTSPIEELPHAQTDTGKKIVFKQLPFLKLTGENLYLLIRKMGEMYSDRYQQADDLITDNADPVAVVKNASATDPDRLMEDIKESKVAKVEGDGDFSYASKSMDYSSVENFMKVLKSDMCDQLGIVSREQELSYVTSGRALDRLYIDMDNDAAGEGEILRDAMKEFLNFVDNQSNTNYGEKFDIVFNTDKPTDEQQIISNISSSKELLSKRTLLEQHPWVGDVDEELERIEEEQEKQPEPQNDFTLEEEPVEENVDVTEEEENEKKIVKEEKEEK